MNVRYYIVCINAWGRVVGWNDVPYDTAEEAQKHFPDWAGKYPGRIWVEKYRTGQRPPMY